VLWLIVLLMFVVCGELFSWVGMVSCISLKIVWMLVCSYLLLRC